MNIIQNVQALNDKYRREGSDSNKHTSLCHIRNLLKNKDFEGSVMRLHFVCSNTIR